MKKSLPIYFVRHRIKNAEKLSTELIKDQKIVFDYDINFIKETPIDKYERQIKNNKSNRKIKLSGFKKTFKLFKELENVKEAYIVVEYYDSEKFYIGHYKKQKIASYSFKHHPGEPEITEAKSFIQHYNSLQLTDLQSYNYSDYPVLLAIRPIYTTICKPSVENYTPKINHILGLEELKFSVNSMHFKMQEQMVENYFRSYVKNKEHKLSYCILKTGEFLKSIDICGRNEKGENLFIQVTNDKEGNRFNKKVEALSQFTKNAITIMVCQKNQLNNPEKGIYYYNLSEIFEEINKVNHQMLKDIIGVSPFKRKGK